MELGVCDERSALPPLSGILYVEASLSCPRACFKEQHPGWEARNLRATQKAKMNVVNYPASPNTAPGNASDRHSGA